MSNNEQMTAMHPTLAKAIVYSKNEYDLIEPFLVFWGNLLGFENVIVIDNGSDDVRVQNIYDKYVPKGVHVKVDKRPHMNVTENMTDNILQWKGTCEWMFLLETDEFLFWVPDAFDPMSIVPKKKITEYLLSQPDNVSILRYGSFWKSCVDPSDENYQDHKFSCAPMEMTKFANQDWDKIIVRMDRFSHVTQWPHHANVIMGDRVVSDKLGLLHYHETGSKRNFERNVTTIRGYGYFDTNMPLHLQVPVCKHFIRFRVAGYHRIEYYLDHIVRLVVIQYFKTFLNRLPHPSEVAEIVAYRNCDHILEHILANMDRLKQNREPARGTKEEDILFYETKSPHEFEVHQVKNYLSLLPPYVTM